MSFIILKPLRQSELGFFEACRRANRETGRQRGLNIDGHLVQKVLRPSDAQEIPVLAHWHDGSQPRTDSRKIRRQQKNWRLTGLMVEGDRFGTVQPGDPVVMLFELRDDGWHLTWDVIQSGAAPELRQQCEQLLDNQSSRLLSPGEAGALLQRLTVTPVFARQTPLPVPSPPRVSAREQTVRDRAPVPHRAARIVTSEADEAIPPNTEHLIYALRSIGYRLEQAIADLIDNSIQAGARTVLVRLVVKDDELVRVLVVDDGSGMGPARLLEALRFGSDTEHPGTSLSKFGMGLKLASLSQCRSLTVVTNDGAQASGRRWTVKGIERGWRAQSLSRSEIESALHTPLSRIGGWRRSGTMVAWDEIDRLGATFSNPARVMVDLRKQLSMHLGLHFHRFIEAGRSGQVRLLEPRVPALTILLETQEDGEDETRMTEQVEPRDPFNYPRSGHEDYPRTFVAALNGAPPIKLRAHVWPARVQLPAYHLDGAQKRQGFYVYRNHRLVQAGGWLRVRQTMDPHLSLARVEMDLPSELDHLFHLDIRKVNITEPPGFADAVLKAGDVLGSNLRFENYLHAAEQVYRRREGTVDSGYPIVPGEGLPKPVRTQFQKDCGTDLDRFREISFEWADLDEDVFFDFERNEDIVYLNRRWRRATLGGRNSSSTDAALVKSLLFLLLEPLFHMGKESRKWKERVAQANRALVRAARYQDRA